MSDIRTSFAILEEAVSGSGVPLHQVTAGDSAAARNTIGALPCRDVSGNIQWIPLDASGNVKVAPQGTISYTNLQAAGTVTAASGYSTVATIALSTSQSYEQYCMNVTASRDCLFQLIWNNNGASNVLGQALVGAGCMAFAQAFLAGGFTSGTGTQQLLIQGKQLNTFSSFTDLHAVVTVKTP